MSDLFSPSTWPPISDLWNREHWSLRQANDAGYYPAPPGGAAPLVPTDSLNYAPGGSSTSIYLDPATTDPSEVSRQRFLDFFNQAGIAAPPDDPNKGSNTMLYVVGGLVAAVLLSRVIGRHR